MEEKSVFKNPEQMKEQLNLPAVVAYSFVGPSTPQYHARVEGIVTQIVGEENIRKRTFRESAGGKYTAYKFEIYHTEFEDVETMYREVMALEGTRFVL
ncbi:DUF493 domain-containing protein [bacterium]|nr:DUF493 domain-containing protein [bacterium]